MKLLYVGDNRNRLNWGCRATSIALRQLLDSRFNVEKVIYGNYVAFAPESGLKVKTKWDKLFRKVSSAIFKTNIISDYITNSPCDNLDNFLKYKDKDENVDFIINSVLECDSIVVNAEGSFIFTSPPRRDTLFFLLIADLAKHFNKGIYFVNGMVSNPSTNNFNLEVFEYTIAKFAESNFITTRDKQSLRKLTSARADINCQYIPDALFTWLHYFYDLEKISISNGDFLIPFPEKEEYFRQVDLSTPYICVGGSSFAANDPKQAVPRYIELVNRLKNLGINIIIVQGCIGDNFLHEVSTHTITPIVPVETPILLAATVLANSKLFVSGRYHPSIMASLGGTPCIFLGSNSHKNTALQEILEYDSVDEFSAYPSSDECNKILKKAKLILEEAEDKRTKIKTVVSKLSQEARKVVEIISL
jgi:polysaccharide pyruvyl transferase WcaK-like protein